MKITVISILWGLSSQFGNVVSMLSMYAKCYALTGVGVIISPRKRRVGISDLSSQPSQAPNHWKVILFISHVWIHDSTEWNLKQHLGSVPKCFVCNSRRIQYGWIERYSSFMCETVYENSRLPVQLRSEMSAEYSCQENICILCCTMQNWIGCWFTCVKMKSDWCWMVGKIWASERGGGDQMSRKLWLDMVHSQTTARVIHVRGNTC